MTEAINMQSYGNFGEYLAAKRISRGISSMEMAELIGISKGYYSDIERSRRNPPEREILDKIIIVLEFSNDEKGVFFDLAGSNNTRFDISPDLTDYIMENKIVRTTLRTAKDKADADDWQHFDDMLKNK